MWINIKTKKKKKILNFKGRSLPISSFLNRFTKNIPQKQRVCSIKYPNIENLLIHNRLPRLVRRDIFSNQSKPLRWTASRYRPLQVIYHSSNFVSNYQMLFNCYCLITVYNSLTTETVNCCNIKRSELADFVGFYLISTSVEVVIIMPNVAFYLSLN